MGHATVAEVQHDEAKVALRRGNDSADEAAKLGLDLHPSPPQELAARAARLQRGEAGSCEAESRMASVAAR